MSTETADTTINAHLVRSAIRKVHLPWLEGTQQETAAKHLGKRMGSAKSVLMAWFDRCKYSNFELNVSVAQLASDAGQSRRNVTRKLRGLEEAGILRRIPNGPHPWKSILNVDVILDNAEAHERRRRAEVVEERDRTYRARAEKEQEKEQRWKKVRNLPRGMSTDLNPTPATTVEGEVAPPTVESEGGQTPVGGSSTFEPAPQIAARKPAPPPSTRAARRRAHRKLSPTQMATALWNLAPWRTSGTRIADETQRWDNYVQSLPPANLWRAINTYCRWMHQGSHKWFAGAATRENFQRYADTIQQCLENPEMPQPGLGRQLRTRELQGRDRTWPQPEAWEHIRPRMNLLHPDLRPLFQELAHEHDVFAKMVEALLDQEGRSPPDWLPEELQARWGELPLFDLT